jgi:hypothetical protein
MVALISYNGTCCVAVNLDPETVTDLGRFERCLSDGFDEVIALGR